MGWCLSVGLLQAMQRLFVKLSGGFESQEVKSSREFPDYRRGESIHSLYVDNFNEIRLLRVDEPRLIATEFQRRFVETKRSWGVVLNDDERVEGAERFSNIGAHFDGQFLGVHRGKRSLLVSCLMMLALGGCGCSYPQLAAIVGIASHCFLYKRPLFSIFEVTYQFLLRFRGGRWLPDSVRRELLCAAGLVLFAESDLRQPIDPFLYSSDASLWGGAFGRTSEPFLRSTLEASDLLRRSDVRGTNIRLHADSSVEAPRASIDMPAGLAWTVLSQFPWGRLRHGIAYRPDSHITLLEGVTFSLLMRFLGQQIVIDKHESSKHDLESVLIDDFTVSRRILCGLDSRGAGGALAKGRSSSHMINRSCRRVCAVTLASGLTAVYYWIPSELMPMDSPSRAFAPRSHRKKQIDSEPHKNVGLADSSDG